MLNKSWYDTDIEKIINNKKQELNELDVHTFTIENGLDILHLQKLLGHSGIRSTMEYLHLANVEKDIVSPLDRLYRSGDENA